MTQASPQRSYQRRNCSGRLWGEGIAGFSTFVRGERSPRFFKVTTLPRRGAIIPAPAGRQQRCPRRTIQSSTLMIQLRPRQHAPSIWARGSPATMIAPISVPSRRVSTAHHGAGNVARLWRDAECGCPVTSGASARPTAHDRAHQGDVTGAEGACRFADQSDEIVASCGRVSRGTGMTRAARAVHLARRNP